ncbi:MAG TPA: hypothetical protein V6C89_02990 [Drouetiella sp.]|jgi:hypothetical protein
MARLFKFILAIFAVFAILVPCVSAADEGGDTKFKVRELPAVKSEKISGKDSHIKVGKKANSKEKPKANPAKSRASGWGAFRVYNKTGWYMDVYEDGTYVGTISPWSYATWTAFGSTSMYCKVDFDNGDSLNWSYAADVQTGEIVYAAPSV